MALYNRKYEITYLINGIMGENRIKIEAMTQTSAVNKFKAIMELSGVKVSSYGINEITLLKGE